MRAVAPSPLMIRTFPRLRAEVAAEIGDRLMPSGLLRQSEIQHDIINGVSVLSCWRAPKHRDGAYEWSALWTILSAGHVLHCQLKRGHPVVSLPLLPCSVVVLHVGTHWHWTTDGTGLLAVANTEHTGECPTDGAVTALFDEAIRMMEPSCDQAA